VKFNKITHCIENLAKINFSVAPVCHKNKPITKGGTFILHYIYYPERFFY